MKPAQKRLFASLAIGAAVALTGLTSVTVAGATNTVRRQGRGSHQEQSGRGHALLQYDSRRDDAPKAPADGVEAGEASSPPERAALKDALGSEGFLDLDPLTGTPRFVGRTDGFLTQPRSGPASNIVLDYLSANSKALGVDRGLGALRLTRDYVDIGGTHHLSWEQSLDGVPLFRNGLQANVAADGRLISITGSPVAGLAAPVNQSKVDEPSSIAAAKADAHQAVQDADGADVSFDGPASATPVLFQTVDGLRRAWRTNVASASHAHSFLSVIDAESGRALLRSSQVMGSGHGWVLDNRPGAAKGGQHHLVDFVARGWLPRGADRLRGNNAHAYTDTDGDFAAEPGEEVGPNAAGNWTYPLRQFNHQPYGCSASYPCTWVSDLATGRYSWKANREQSATQAFHFVNTFHDHLAAPPIGFTEAAGNFQAVNSSGQGTAADPVEVHALLGANTLRVNGKLVGLPDYNHSDNAFMETPPDGTAPNMGLMLWQDPTDPTDDFFIAADSSNVGDLVYHEYTHGLSNRLVVDPQGRSTLFESFQGLAMGEGWSDFYALDYLISQGLLTDSSADGEIMQGDYLIRGEGLFRRNAMDCPVGSSAARCQGGTDPASLAGPGGFTYGDMTKILGFPELHADGEIWAETLWDLRTALGSDTTMGLVTRAMELSPAGPSFLDERNAILQADRVAFGGAHRKAIWSVFARRGMGYFAGTTKDAFPPAPFELPHDGFGEAIAEDFHLPPPPGTPTTTVRGRVLDRDTGQPIQGARVQFGAQPGFAPNPSALTGRDGGYEIRSVVPGTYPLVYVNPWATGLGYEFAQRPVTVADAGSTTVDWSLHRDWASWLAGGSVASFTGPDYSSYGCGPGGAIDLFYGGWGSDVVDGAGRPPKVTIRLPRAIDVTQFLFMHGASCGDDFTASTKDYRIETSRDGQTWKTASEGSIDPDAGFSTAITPTGARWAVRYVRLTLLAPQLFAPCSEHPEQSGCHFIDMTELEVFGVPWQKPNS